MIALIIPSLLYFVSSPPAHSFCTITIVCITEANDLVPKQDRSLDRFQLMTTLQTISKSHQGLVNPTKNQFFIVPTTISLAAFFSFRATKGTPSYHRHLLLPSLPPSLSPRPSPRHFASWHSGPWRKGNKGHIPSMTHGWTSSHPLPNGTHKG